jgi:gluconokinase
MTGESKQEATVVVVMGVSGVGKTTIGQRLARDLGWSFFDADDFHPEANVLKMHQGMGLADADRFPWLKALNKLISGCLSEGVSAVLACSALKESYRQVLKQGNERLCFVFLSAPPEIIQDRLNQRTGHFMSPLLLASQFETLEIPEDAIHVYAVGSPEKIVKEIRQRAGL